MNAIYFDADKWHQKLLEEEKFFDELTALANDTGAATSHLDELDTTDPFTKNYLRAKTIERVQGGISTFHRQLIVLVVTLCEAMTKEFFYCLFRSKNPHMREYLKGDRSNNLKGVVYFSEVIDSSTKDDLIMKLAERASQVATQGKIEDIIKRIEKHSKGEFDGDLKKALPIVYRKRHIFVHEADDSTLDSEVISNIFKIATFYLQQLIGFSESLEMAVNDPQKLSKNRILVNLKIDEDLWTH
jgi:hypothetical protein